MIFAPSEDSDQPAHPPSLIRVFDCAQWVGKDPNFLHPDSENLIRLGGCPGWSESSLGEHAILFVGFPKVSYFLLMQCIYAVIKQILSSKQCIYFFSLK